MRNDRAAQRGKPLDADCYKAKRVTNEYGLNDNRIFCCGLIDSMTEEYLPKCQECGAFIDNAKRPEEEEKKLCSFDGVPCHKKCIYFNTCTRNPYRYDQKGAQP